LVGGPGFKLVLDPDRGGRAGGWGDNFRRGGRGGFSPYAGGAGLELRLRLIEGAPGYNIDVLIGIFTLPFPASFPVPLPTARLIILSNNPRVLALI